MKLESISVAGKDANQLVVGKKFLIISISLTVLLNLSIAIWFFINDRQLQCDMETDTE